MTVDYDRADDESSREGHTRLKIFRFACVNNKNKNKNSFGAGAPNTPIDKGGKHLDGIAKSKTASTTARRRMQAQSFGRIRRSVCNCEFAGRNGQKGNTLKWGLSSSASIRQLPQKFPAISDHKPVEQIRLQGNSNFSCG